MQKKKSQSNWKRKLTQQEKTVCRQIKAQIKEKQKAKQGLTSDEITSTMSGVDNFIGCYAEDQLSNITFTSFPCFIIVNIDSSNLPGSHWITIRFDRKSIEVFDPAGFEIFNWSRIPCTLLNFIHKLTVSRQITLSSRLQSPKSHLCGFYCIFYVLYRNHHSLSQLSSLFTTDLSRNDRRLKNLL